MPIQPICKISITRAVLRNQGPLNRHQPSKQLCLKSRDRGRLNWFKVQNWKMATFHNSKPITRALRACISWELNSREKGNAEYWPSLVQPVLRKKPRNKLYQHTLQVPYKWMQQSFQRITKYQKPLPSSHQRKAVGVRYLPQRIHPQRKHGEAQINDPLFSNQRRWFARPRRMNEWI